MGSLPRALLASAFGLGLLVRLIVASLPESVLLTQVVPDDAFYYFVIARNAALGLGFTFDGLLATNGFHPLWALALTPVFGLFQGPDVAITASLVLGALLDLGAAYCLVRVAERIQPRSGPWVAAIYLFNPRIVLESVNGLETSLAMFFLASFLWLLATREEADRGVGDGVVLGGLAGLCFLARTDLAVIVAAVSVGWALRRMQRAGVAIWRDVNFLRKLAAFIGVGILVVLPWFLWSLDRVGTIWQSSAVALPALIQDRIAQGGDLWGGLYGPVLNFSLRAAVIYPGAAWLVWAIASLVPRLRFAYSPDPRMGADGVRESDGSGATDPPRAGDPTGAPPGLWSERMLWIALGGAAVLLAVHTVVRWYPRGWYFVPWAGLVSVVAGIHAARFSRRTPRLWSRGLAALIVLLFALQSVRMTQDVAYPGQPDWVRAGAWIRQNTPADTVIGAFNAGILAYYADRTVINLDGAVDWGAVHARDQRRLLPYLQAREGRFVIDRSAYLFGSYGPYLGPGKEDLRVIRRFDPVGSPYGSLVLFELDPEHDAAR